MKNLMVIFTLFSALCFGQQDSPKEDLAINPLYILDGMIANEPQIKMITTAEIAAISIYKSDNLPKNLESFSNFADDGIIDIILKQKDVQFNSISFEKLNITNNLNELNPIYINNILVKGTANRILEDAILDTEIIEKNGQKFLNIWTVAKDQRKGIAKVMRGKKINQSNRDTFKSEILK